MKFLKDIIFYEGEHCDICGVVGAYQVDEDYICEECYYACMEDIIDKGDFYEDDETT